MADIATIGLKVDSKGVVQATKNLDRMGKEGNKTTATVRKLGSAFGALAAAIGAGALFRGAIQATVEQERVTAQLDQTLRSTGRYTPELSQQMQDYASSLQQVTIFGDEALIGAQAMLLTFTQIGGETFPRAQEAILDVATAMGTDLRAATIQVGKALNDPVRGVTALAESGIQFTDAQRDMIKEMVETNRVAEAQALILNELEVQFGGSARAARDTLGGSLASLRNAFGDLLEGDAGGEGVKGATQAINDLTDVLSSSELKQAFESMISLMARAATGAANLLVHINDLFTTSLEEQSNQAIQNVEQLERRLENVRNPQARLRIKEELDEALKVSEELQLRIWSLSNRGGQDTPIIPTASGGSGQGDTPKDRTDQEIFGRVIRIDAPEELTERNLIMERYNELLEESDRIAESVKSPQELFQEEIALLNELRETTSLTNGERLLSQEQYVAAVEAAQDRLADATKDSTSKMTQFAQQAANNMQDAFADGFFDIFTGKTNDLAESFSNMLQRMAADLAASSVLDFLVGDFASGEGLGGVAKEGLDFIKSSFDGGGFTGMGSRSGGIDGKGGFPAVLHPNETVVDHTRGQSMGGTSVTVNVDASGSSVEGDDEQSNQLGRLIGASVRSVIIEERRPGGLLG